MTKVLVTKDKLDTLAEIVGGKSNTNVPLTIDEMITAADSITSGGGGTVNLQTKSETYTPSTSAINDTITADVGYDGLEEVDVTVNAMPIFSGGVNIDKQYATVGGSRKWQVKGVVSCDDGEEGYVGSDISGEWFTYNAVPTGTTITPSTSSQTIGGANYMMEGAVTVSAMPSMTLPSTASGTATGTRKATIASSTSTQYINIPTGYNSANAYYQLSPPSAMTLPTTTSGTATGTLKATVTPGTSNKYINIPTGYNSANAYYTVSGDANLVAGNIKSGTSIFGVTGSYTGGGGGDSKNVQVLQSTSRTNASSLTKVLGDLTVSKTGTYDIYWSGGRTNTSTSYTWGTRLYVDGTGYGTENTTWTNNCQSNHLSNVSLTANQKLSVYARGRSGSYYTFAPMLVIVEA